MSGLVPSIQDTSLKSALYSSGCLSARKVIGLEFAGPVTLIDRTTGAAVGVGAAAAAVALTIITPTRLTVIPSRRPRAAGRRDPKGRLVASREVTY